ncbi:hypothetical protein JYQ62_30685 [Nostoc sp. UHCC 0702]|nr:hypothetical protein JYQ62_30685 [Nostoc sp. UHCC 0702]
MLEKPVQIEEVANAIIQNDEIPIESKQELIAALQDAAELEHQFMCMYLYTAFSLKKEADDSCSEAQLECVRRWASQIYAIARQEMEHLSLVNSMLAAIGAPPHFARRNIPLLPSYLSSKVLSRYNVCSCERLTPCDLPITFEPFSLQSARRYTCMESPTLSHLQGEEYKTAKQWCFKDPHGNCQCINTPNQNKTLYQSLKASQYSHYFKHTLKSKASQASDQSQDEDIILGTIEKMYRRIKKGFQTVAAQEPPLFVSHCDQHQVDILSEYNIYIFPVTDLLSACNAIDLITEQGEGIGGLKGLNNHFSTFYKIAQEYAEISQEDRKFKPALLVPTNPRNDSVTDAFTKQVLELFNDSYVTLVYVLTGLYKLYQPIELTESYPHLIAALREIAFAPAMTMLVRSLGEIIVQLPLEKDSTLRAAPNFYLPDADYQQLNLSIKDTKNDDDKFRNINIYLERFNKIQARLKQLSQEKDAPEDVKKSLDYIYQNIYRLTGNLREIYQTGVYPKFYTTP